MKLIGYLLIAAAFLIATLVAVQQVLEVNWMWFVPFVVVGFVGVVVVRKASHAETRAEDKVAANIGVVHSSLEQVVQKVAQLNADKANINTYDMRLRIDDTVLTHLDDFVAVRESIGHKYGLQEYADVMSSYAAGERYLNRVWSASADGYIDEVNAFMDRAEAQFKDAFEHLKQLEASHH
jgi:RNase adaptor protein for sRNA GlmZ degradation